MKKSECLPSLRRPRAFARAALILTIATAFLAAPATPLWAVDPPVTVGASPKAAALLAKFYARAGKKKNRVAIGQQMPTYEYGSKNDPSSWYGAWLEMKREHLPLPEIMGGELSDLMSYDGFSPNRNALRELLKHGKKHIVTLVWHPSNPVAGGDFSTPVSTAELENMTNPATPTGAAWRVQLDRAAAALAPFAARDIPVVFRPLHEQNGNFFWWGHNGATGADLVVRQSAWTDLWQDMVTYLTVTKGLKNLLFVFGTNQVNYAEVVPPLTYYPGSSLVDLVSIDVYNDKLNLAGGQSGLEYYQQLISTGKPFGLSEFGQSAGNNGTGKGAQNWDARLLATRLKHAYKQAVFATAWYSSSEGKHSFIFALPDVAHTRELLKNPIIDTQ